MSNVRILFPTVILPLALTMGACSNEDKGGTEEITAPEVEILDIKSVDSKAFEKLLKVDSRKVKTSEANLALAQWGLDTPDGAFAWDKKSGKAGSYTYTNLSGTGKAGEDIKIEKLELTGVHMTEADTASFDRIDIQGLDVTDEDALVTVDRLSLSHPTPELGASILKAIDRIETIKDLRGLDLDIGIDHEDMGFEALLIDGVSVKSDDGNVTLGTVGWGENSRTNKGLFLLEDLDLTHRKNKDDMPVHLTLKSISGTGIDTDYVQSLKGDNKRGNLLSPYKKGFENFALKGLEVNADTLTFSVPSVSGEMEKRGDDVIVKQALEPMTLTASGMPQDASLADAWQRLQLAGFESLEFSGGSTTILNEKDDTIKIKDSFLSLKDGFDLQFGLEAQGLAAVTQKSRTRDEKIKTDDLMNTLNLSSLNLSFTDKSIIDRAINVIAAEQNQKPANLKKAGKGSLMAAGFMMSLQADTPEQQKFITKAVGALSGFLDDGGTLQVSLNPAEPLPAGYLTDLSLQTLDTDRMGLNIEHTP